MTAYVERTLDRKRGETVTLYVYDVQFFNFTSQNYENVQCDTGYPKVTIEDPTGAVKVNASVMTQVGGDNEYIYSYDLADNAPYGWWPCKAELRYDDGGGTIHKEVERFGFRVS